MWWFIGGLIVVIFFTYCLCKTASDADDREEKWWKEHEADMNNKGDNNAN